MFIGRDFVTFGIIFICDWRRTFATSKGVTKSEVINAPVEAAVAFFIEFSKSIFCFVTNSEMNSANCFSLGRIRWFSSQIPEYKEVPSQLLDEAPCCCKHQIGFSSNQKTTWFLPPIRIILNFKIQPIIGHNEFDWFVASAHRKASSLPCVSWALGTGSDLKILYTQDVSFYCER